MSQWRGRIEEIEDAGDLLPYVERYYQLPVLLGLLAFMLWSRVRDWRNFLVEGTVYFAGNDPWYHYRMVSYTVRHWPETSPFDPWTHFPFGTHSSQFGTVFDQLMATAALVVGLGNPSDHTVRLVVLFAPAIFGTATAIPAYLIGKRLGGRFAGLVVVGVMALFGSTFVSRGTVGFSDHHIAEVFFQTTAILATMVAVSVAEREKPVWELVEQRDVAAVRRPVGWAVVAGVATSFYIWTWPPGVFLIGILGVYYLVELSSLQAHGDSPEPVALAGAVQLGTTGVLTLAVIEEINISATSFNLLQPGLALAVAAGCIFMAWLARQWDARDLPAYQYPPAVVGIIAVLAGLTALLLPDFFGFMTNQITRVIGLSSSDTAGTIGEAQSLPFDALYPRYRFTLFVGLAGVAFVGLKQFLSKPRSEVLVVAVWTVFMLLATLTQRRFDYYFGVTVAVMTGYTLAVLADFTNLFDSIEDIDTWQVLAIVAVVVVVFAPFVVTGGGILSMQVSATGPGQAPQAWNESLAWMEENTPAEGNLAGAGNGMGLYGTFANTEDFAYEDGFYGVLSWWDYGHWITVMGERIPNANPFQQGANMAANFLLSGSEERANAVIEQLDDGNGTQTRYVMVDWKMVETEQAFRFAGGARNLNGKYFAPFLFFEGDISQRNYYRQLLYQTGQRSSVRYRTFMRHQQPYYNSTVVRLYRFHGSAVQPSPVVLDWERQTINGRTFPVSQGIKRFDNMSAARNFTANDPTSQVGGVGQFPEERVPAMEHYRLVGTSDRSATQSQRYLLALRKTARGAFQTPIRSPIGLNQRLMQALHYGHPQWVKVFERVPGATIRGEGAPPNTEVQAAVRLRVPASGTAFVYRQRTTSNADGEFTMTVPYSTTGYEKWGPEEGYTNVSVRATTAYRFRTVEITNESGYTYRYVGSTNVTEGQVIGEVDEAPTVTLERGNATLPPNERITVNVTQKNQSDGTSGASGDATATPTPEPDSTSGSTSTATSTPTPTPTGALSGPDVTPLASTVALLAPLAGLYGVLVVGRGE